MKFTLGRLIALWMFLPLLLGIPACIVGGVLGCQMDAVGPHPCSILGLVDIGGALALFSGLLIIAPFTIFTGAMIGIPIAFGRSVARAVSKKGR